MNRLEFVDLKRQYAELEDRIGERRQRVLDHGQDIIGPKVRELEQAPEARNGAKHCISVASGTEALLISLMAIGLKPGDELVTTPFTFAATAEVIVLIGSVEGLQLPGLRADRDCVWAQYTVQLDERDRVRASLQALGIPAAVHYPLPLHHQPANAAHGNADARPASVVVASRVPSLPMHADLALAEQDAVAEALCGALAGC